MPGFEMATHPVHFIEYNGHWKHPLAELYPRKCYFAAGQEKKVRFIQEPHIIQVVIYLENILVKISLTI